VDEKNRRELLAIEIYAVAMFRSGHTKDDGTPCSNVTEGRLLILPLSIGIPGIYAGTGSAFSRESG
jgi:hypothetical protein